MRPKIAFILLLFFAVTLGFSSQLGQSVGSSDFVVFRANISPMYIANQSVVIQALAVPFHDNKPIMATVHVHVKISGLNIKYFYNSTFNVVSGRGQTLYLPALQEGHYEIWTWADYEGIKSKVIDEDFGVTKAPVPYQLTISSDGSLITFKSLRLNATGYPDPNYPFTLMIFVDSHGTGESLVDTITNVTNLTIHVPASWKTGILYVEVVDCYGWHNGNSINLAEMQFSGTPVSYDYYYYTRVPYRGWTLDHVIMALVVFLVVLYFVVRWSLAANSRR